MYPKIRECRRRPRCGLLCLCAPVLGNLIHPFPCEVRGARLAVVLFRWHGRATDPADGLRPRRTRDCGRGSLGFPFPALGQRRGARLLPVGALDAGPESISCPLG